MIIELIPGGVKVSETGKPDQLLPLGGWTVRVIPPTQNGNQSVLRPIGFTSCNNSYGITAVKDHYSLSLGISACFAIITAPLLPTAYFAAESLFEMLNAGTEATVTAWTKDDITAGSNGQTTFTLLSGSVTVDAADVRVFLNGVLLTVGSDYVAPSVSDTSITYSGTPVLTGDVLTVWYK